MATLENVRVPKNDWIDIYAATGIAVGTAIYIQNVGVADVYVTVSATKPALNYDAYNILQRDGTFLRNEAGAEGAWATCRNAEGKINVGVI
jgi:hypothetical protein